MKKLQKIISPLLLIAFVAASLLLCCYNPALAAANVSMPACHQHHSNKSSTPTQNHSCCQKNMMMQVGVVDQDLIKDNLNKRTFDLLALALSPTLTVSQTSSYHQFPISPQKFSSIPIYLKTHTLRI